MPPLPALVLVPASFTPPHLYTRFASALDNLGLKSKTISLPSVGLKSTGKKPGLMTDDAAEIARVIDEFYAEDESIEEIVLVAHSYGGIPASESMKFLSTKNRAATSGKKGVSRIVYVAGIVLPVGVSNDEMRKRPPPPWVVIDDDWITDDPTKGVKYDFNDLPEGEGLALALQAQQQSTRSFRERATYPGYNDVEVLYVRCTNDQVLPAQGMERILNVIRESSGREPRILEFDSGHNPQMSKPEAFAEYMKKVLTE